MRYEFFASADEQRQWLSAFILRDAVWCRAWVHDEGDFDIESSEDVARLSFERKVPCQIQLGNLTLSRPIWDRSPQGRTLNQIRSRSVQFLPAARAGSNILLEGGIAILSPSYYSRDGIDHKPIQTWFRAVKRSLSETMMTDHLITVQAPDGRVTEWPSMGVSKAAVDWYRNGKLLKQFENGPLIYHVRPR